MQNLNELADLNLNEIGENKTFESPEEVMRHYREKRAGILTDHLKKKQGMA